MTVQGLKNSLKGKFVDIEFYVDKFQPQAGFHADRVEYVEAIDDDTEVAEYALMDKSEYESALLSNCSIAFTDIYPEDATVLAVKIKK